MVLTSPGILKSWRESGGKNTKDAKHSDQETNAIAILDLAQAGDARAKRIVRKRAEIVADIIVRSFLDSESEPDPVERRNWRASGVD